MSTWRAPWALSWKGSLPSFDRAGEASAVTEPRVRKGIRIAQLGLLTNAALAVVKVVTGILGHSQALIADGISPPPMCARRPWSGAAFGLPPAPRTKTTRSDTERPSRSRRWRSDSSWCWRRSRSLPNRSVDPDPASDAPAIHAGGPGRGGVHKGGAVSAGSRGGGGRGQHCGAGRRLASPQRRHYVRRRVHRDLRRSHRRARMGSRG